MVPDYHRPEAPVPQRWDAAGEPAVWPDPEWWRSFASRELDGLIVQAIADNRNLRAAVARIRQAEAQARIAGADLYPSLSAGGAASRTKRASSNLGTTSRPGFTTYQASLTASYQLDLFGENSATAAAAETRLESSLYDRQTVALTLLSDIANTYFQVLTARERRRLAEETLDNAESILELLEQRQGAGTVSDLEVAQQRSAVATQRAALPALLLSERLSLNALAVLLGRPPEGLAVETRSLADIRLPPVVAGLPSALLERRPDLRKAEADLRAANFDIGTARAARFPSVQLTADGGTVSGALSGLFGPGTFFYTLTSSLTAPIFAGGRLEGQEELNRARFAELIETYQQAILAAFQDVEDALSTAEQNGRQYGFSREAYEQARAAYRLADLRFRVGTVDFLTVLEAQRTVFQAADALVQADAARYNAIVGVYRALGGGWDGDAATLLPR
jgi:NodT family efflux transporter outer membrane factor (OMF) lipoprotein